MAVFAACAAFLLLLATAAGRELSALQRGLYGPSRALGSRDVPHSLNVSTCPGYALTALRESEHGLTAQLDLAGPACNAFGTDFANLTISVTYETQTRLHVSIADANRSNFVVPDSVLPRPHGTHPKPASDLVFHYHPRPFAFWITRRSAPAHAAPLFDTRPSSLPATPLPPFVAGDNSTALDGFPLVFEDQYLQLTSALPKGTNIYGLGEVVASAGVRRDVGVDADGNPTRGTVQTMWARDIADPVDENEYGIHPFYIEQRYPDPSSSSSSSSSSQSERESKSEAHGVFLASAAGSDVLLATPPGSPVSLIEYRLLGGTLDFYFLSGPDPLSVAEQYSEIVGTPTWQPYWAFGFHLCRWGYASVNETKEQVAAMRAAGIPLEVMWNDIDVYRAFRDFTSDPVSFPGAEMRAFVRELHADHQRYVPIVDAAVAHVVNNGTDVYDPYTSGAERDVFVKNPDGSAYVGQVWPGYTVFPDWFSEEAAGWWAEALRNWTDGGVTFDGLWLDMNEASSFCDGSCGTGIDISNTSTPFLLPGVPGNPVSTYPECYDVDRFGPSGNITVNGTLTCNATSSFSAALTERADLVERKKDEKKDEKKERKKDEKKRRGLGAGGQPDVELNAPPYAIHNGNGRLSLHALATNATHAGGFVELDTHNLWGTMEAIASHKALLDILPGKRPFIISRSTFAGAGRWTGHWLGDNFSLWSYMRYAIQGVLQFQMFQVPMVGADTCGFNGNTDEELCNRWMQLSAFFPFYRNHNELGALSQEPYRWDSVANASRTAIATRYALLPYWYSLFANASTRGTPPVRPLAFAFPDQPALAGLSDQFLVGPNVLVTPVLEPNATSVTGVFPAGAVWRDWYTHELVNMNVNGDGNGTATATLDAPLGHINVHVRDGAAMLLHAEPGYTTTETREGPYELLVVLTADGHAQGEAYVDDGISVQPTPSKTVKFVASHGKLTVKPEGKYEIAPKLTRVTILGAPHASSVEVGGKKAAHVSVDAGLQKVVVSGLELDLNRAQTITWS
ncbi:hypothetical protein PUNSTDRAFT_47500 [Punctularia strigosozonata HHB-11173 SS5]|uniref:Uncharacterized protein n=1 Tax=Punctularia strigosozonata (strain HHB-11173) TaxID=741275 RepID=R7S5A3_PUNST|nr:uncharacterized protein PUNSTDRAFT_47500 [Punctularia strigosozonata HHB-11173 SS5]EIN04541.1 hypothetical protein PUNSTDRAFT_47500 [Punctularia strigosozonata HHB-11173 SS5]